MDIHSGLGVRAATRDDWPVLLELMGKEGVGGGCWCQWPVVPRGGKLWRSCQGEPNKRAFRDQFRAGSVHGSLAFEDGKPVGWCRYGPTADFPRLANSPSLNTSPPPGTWSIVCFYIPARQRGRGIASALLDHALDSMRSRDVELVEAYPVPEKSFEGRPVPPAFAWTGVVPMFRRAGFRVHARPGIKRRVYRLVLD